MPEKYLYFRAQATDGDDDATGDSALWPASSLMGMQPTADDELTLYFKSMVRRDPTGSLDHANNLDNHDTVVLELATNNTHLTAFKAICQNIQYSKTALIVIANDDSDGTEYLAGSGIDGCGAITVSAAYTNA